MSSHTGNNQSNSFRTRRKSENDEDSKQRKCGLCKQTGTNLFSSN